MRPIRMIGIWFFLASVPAWSGDVVGNGGDGVVCRTQTGDLKSIEILDFYEARVDRGVTHDLGATGLTLREKLNVALSRLERLSPTRARLYREQAEEFLATPPTPGIELVDIPDSGHLFFPRGCKVEQVVIQREPHFPGEKRYIISKDLWDRMDADSQAGMVLHELIYREGIALGHTNSISSRYFNSWVTSKGFESLDMAGLVSILYDLPFVRQTIDEVEISLFVLVADGEGNLQPDFKQPIRPTLRADGTLIHALSYPGSEYWWNTDRILIQGEIDFSAPFVPKRMQLASSVFHTLAGRLIEFGKDSVLDFHSEYGDLERASLARVLGGNQPKPMGWIRFKYYSGEILEAEYP